MQLLNFPYRCHKSKIKWVVSSIIFILLSSVIVKADEESIRFEFTAYVEQEMCDIIVEDLEVPTDEIDFGIVSMNQIINKEIKTQFEIILEDCVGNFSNSYIKLESGSVVAGSNDKVFNTDPDAYFGVAIMDEDEDEYFGVGDIVFEDIEDGDEHIILTAVLACYDLQETCSDDDMGEFTAHVTFSYYSD